MDTPAPPAPPAGRLVGTSISTELVAVVATFIGVGAAVAGVYVLAGIGWALIAVAVPFLIIAVLLIRGLMRAG